MWGAGLAPYQERVLADLRALIPAAPEGGAGPTVLDAGCGDGALTNRLRDLCTITGMDRSRTALAHLECPGVVGSVDAMPFADRAFRVVMCNDTMEHLPDAVHDRAAAELGRVASDRVIVTVPWREVLGAARTRCADCGASYHINHHARSYGHRELAGLLGEGWRCTAVVHSGLDVTTIERAQQLLRAELGWHIRWDLAMCPACGSGRSISGEPHEHAALINELAETLADRVAREEPGRNEAVGVYDRAGEPCPDGPRLVAVEAGVVRELGGAVDEDASGLLIRGVWDGRGRVGVAWGVQGVRHLLTDPQEAADGGWRLPAWFRPEVLGGQASAVEGIATGAALLAAAAERRRLIVDNQNLRALADQRRSSEAEISERLAAATARCADALRSAHVSSEEASRQRAEIAKLRRETERSAVFTGSLLAELDRLRSDNETLMRSESDMREHVRFAEEQTALVRDRLAEVEASAAYTHRLATDRWFRYRVRIKRLGHGGLMGRAALRDLLLAQAEPRTTDPGWAKEREGRRSFVMLCHDQRIDRRIIHQAQALLGAGWAGRVIAMSFDQNDTLDTVDGVPVHRIGLARLVPDCPAYFAYHGRQRWVNWLAVGHGTLSKVNEAWYHRALRWRYRGKTVAHPLPFDHAYRAAARAYPADLIVAHDLPAVRAAVETGREQGARVVYDAHELYSEQRGFAKPQKRLLDDAERTWGPACDAVITVSRSFGDLMERKSGIRDIRVIRNVTNRRAASDRRGRVFHERLGLDPDARVVLFQGSIVPDQNLHTLVEGFVDAGLDRTHLVFLGPTNTATEADLKQRAGQALGRSVHFLEPVGQDVLLGYTESAHFGVIPYLPYDLNCRYCMPNKLFEYIQAGLPVLASDLVEIRGVLEGAGGGGMLADLSSTEKMGAALRAMFARDLDRDRAVLLEAAKELCWERERERYLEIIEEVMAGARV